MTEQLTGYEASSVDEIEAVLDDLPADAKEVYLRTIGYSERAIAAVAAKRAGGGGAAFNGGTITDPLTIDNSAGAGGLALEVKGNDNVTAAVFVTDLGGSHLDVGEGGQMALFDGSGNYASFAISDSLGGQVNISSGSGISVVPVADDTLSVSVAVAPGDYASGLYVAGQALVGQFRLDGAARPVISTHSAPDDASPIFAAGDCALWFDPTPGAAKLMLKAKDANGSVVTASVALA